MPVDKKKRRLDRDEGGDQSPNPRKKIKTQGNETRTSNYGGVFWHPTERKWIAQINHHRNTIFIGRYDTELRAALNVNIKCAELGIAIMNPNLGGMTITSAARPPPPARPEIPQSEYHGVSWNKKEQKWSARFIHNNAPHFLGYFEDDREAAIKINMHCKHMGIQLRNPNLPSNLSNFMRNRISTSPRVVRPERHPERMDIDSIDAKFDGLVETGTRRSIYNCVYYKPKRRNKWRAQIRVGTELLHIGYFETERKAALAVNAKCRELDIEPKNFINESQEDLAFTENISRKSEKRPPDLRKKMSKYNNVYWDPKSGQWGAEIVHNGITYPLGTFLTETYAGIGVNDKCMELEISLKNPSLSVSEKTMLKLLKNRKFKKEMVRKQRTKAPSKGSRFDSVYWHKKNLKWLAEIRHQGRRIHCGYWIRQEQAARAVNEKCKEMGIPIRNPSVEKQKNNHDRNGMSNKSSPTESSSALPKFPNILGTTVENNTVDTDDVEMQSVGGRTTDTDLATIKSSNGDVRMSSPPLASQLQPQPRSQIQPVRRRRHDSSNEQQLNRRPKKSKQNLKRDQRRRQIAKLKKQMELINEKINLQNELLQKKDQIILKQKVFLKNAKKVIDRNKRTVKLKRRRVLRAEAKQQKRSDNKKASTKTMNLNNE